MDNNTELYLVGQYGDNPEDGIKFIGIFSDMATAEAAKNYILAAKLNTDILPYIDIEKMELNKIIQ